MDNYWRILLCILIVVVAILGVTVLIFFAVGIGRSMGHLVQIFGVRGKNKKNDYIESLSN